MMVTIPYRFAALAAASGLFVLLAAPASAAASRDSGEHDVRAATTTSLRHAREDATERRICVVEQITGSRVMRRICKTEQEWEAEALASDLRP